MMKIFNAQMFLSVTMIFIIACSQPNSNTEKYAVNVGEKNFAMSEDGTAYSVVFEKNDAEATGAMDSLTVLAGDGIVLPANAFSKTGWTFKGWAASADGIPVYADQASLTMGNIDIVLYARWEYDGVALLEKRDMVLITGGTYDQVELGGTHFVHTVSDFYIARYETPYPVWYAVRQWAVSNGYVFSTAGREGSSGKIGSLPANGSNQPVTYLKWRDAIVWCNAYSEMTGLNPVYTYNGALIKDSSDQNAASCDQAICDWAKNGYRLPSEGEWHYAASNKGLTPYDYASGAMANYTDTVETQKVAWYVSNAGSTKNVGTTENSNELTIYDMSGNVMEFCWDWDGAYPVDPQVNYRGMPEGTKRMILGGSSRSRVEAVIIGLRASSQPSINQNVIGFRVARTY
jgi:uncharacterized repeat protein (TIGR02543 family)